MTDSDPDLVSNINRSGGADLTAGRDLTVGGDVVGRDKIVSNTTIFTGDQQYDVHGLANPYLGLQSFTYADHAKYAGREKLIAETVAHLTALDDPLALLFITGASGSGKSSFVQAGVLPALEKHYAALSMKWAVFRPSRDPLAALADALWRQLGLPQFDPSAASSADFGDFLKSHTPPQQINVIVIDQFEELFTQSNAQPRDALFALLTQLPPFQTTRTHIIATVRADYLPELFGLPTLYDIAKHGIDLRAMSVDELREAIQQPLRATYPDKDKRFQEELVERLAQDAAEDAAYLPLLQVTLEEIWRKGALTVGSYTNLADAIKQRADKVLAYQDYDAAQPNQPRLPEEQAAILNLCLDLVDVSLDDEARRDVRRRRSKDELISGAPERARLIEALTEARLLSVDTESDEPSRVEVDLIHESLLSNWDRLRQAIAERRHELRQRVRFEQQLKEWIGQDRSGDYLLSGVRLAEARELERRDDVALHSADAKDFVQGSIEREEERRQKELNDAKRMAEAAQARAIAERRVARRTRLLLIIVSLIAAALAWSPLDSLLLKWQARGETVNVPAGDFVLSMLDDTGRPHILQVHVFEFRLEKYEVTNAQYRLCVQDRACSEPANLALYEGADKAKMPLVAITLKQAADYCQWIGRQVPTEQEWEWAAKGREGWKYPTGNEEPNTRTINIDNFNLDLSQEHRLAVDLLPPDKSGTFGLAGNVMEWTVSYWLTYDDPRYAAAFWGSKSSQPIEAGQLVVARGGGWAGTISQALSTSRYPLDPALPADYVGLRCVETTGRKVP